MLAPLKVLAPGILAVQLVLPPSDQYLGSRQMECPDGVAVVEEMYDPDPADANAVILVYRKGVKVIAMYDSRNGLVILHTGERMLATDARLRWRSPCDVP